MKQPQLQLPEVDLWDFLFERAELPFPVDRAIYTNPTTKRSYTYEDVKDTAFRFGRNLQQRWHWRPGDVLAVFSPNCIDTPAVAGGCHYAGGVVSPANPSYSVEDLRYHMVDSGAKAIVLHSSKFEVGLEAARRAYLPPDRVLYVGESPSTDGYVVPHFSAMTSDVGGEVHRGYRPSPIDLAYLVYSSGTTGLPKAVMITHGNVVSAIKLETMVDGAYLTGPKEALLAVLPTYHIYGLICLIYLPIYLGIRTFMMQEFRLDFFCRCVQEFSITHTYVAPPVILHLAKSPVVAQYNLGSLRMITSGGAPLSRDLVDTMYQRLRIPVRQAYGLTETTAISHVQAWDKWSQAPGSNGPALPGLEAKFVDEEGNLASKGEPGELWIWGPTIFKGYLNNAGATREVLTPDRWFKTGDIGYQDKDGNMFITDRSKELIKYKGFQVGPAELEGVLQGHNLISDVAVVGVENANIASEVPLAYVVLSEPSNASEETALDIIEFLKKRMVPHKWLKGGVVWTDEIPKSPSGKILRRVLKQRAVRDYEKALGAVVYNQYLPKL